MRGVWTVAEVRAAEDAVMARQRPGVLMQRAAHALSVECADVLGTVYGARVVLLVGSGSNGGDALFAGARLARRGAHVTAVLLDPARAHREGLAGFLAAGGRVTDRPRLPAADLVVDGILGIGGRGGLRGPAADLTAAAAGLLTVAVDLPSGVDADTGAAGDCAVRADVTVTFGCLKPGLVIGAGARLAGEVRLVDIGLGEALPAPTVRVLEARDVAALLPEPTADDDKYTRGVVGVLAGSVQYAGAGVLATGGAAHSGAGMVRYLGGAPAGIRARFPAAVVHEGTAPGEVRVQSWVAGPGMGVDDAAAALLAQVLATDVPAVVDADGITLLARNPRLLEDRAAPTVLTPHDREFARLAGEVGPDRIAAARRAARDLGATVLLKGEATVVAAPDGTAYVNPTGTPWLATAGTGDVLSGMIGALLAGGLSAPEAAAAAAYVHGVAGQLAAADGPVTAAEVLDRLRDAYRVVRL